MGGSSFTAGEESVTLDFANAEIAKNDESIELSDLAEGISCSTAIPSRWQTARC